MKSKIFILFLFVSNFLKPVFSQDYSTAGGFLFRQYGVKTYGAHPRNFSIIQDSRGIMYFGNAYGVIEFDGSSWKNISLPNGSSVLSFGNNQGEIWVGGYNEFGVLSHDAVGKIFYKPIPVSLNKSQSMLGGVIGIHSLNNSIVLQTYNGTYHFINNSFNKISTKSNAEFQFSKIINGELYFHESKEGLVLFSDNSMKRVEGGTLLIDKDIKDIVPFVKNELLVLEKGGVYVFDHKKLIPLNESSNHVLKDCAIRKMLRLQNGTILISTGDKGFFILDKKGKILHQVNRLNGFPSNSINDIFVDKKGGVWFALENGIVYMELNSPLNYLGLAEGINGMGYAAVVHHSKLYLGTSEGLYYCDWTLERNYSRFKQVEGIHGQVWNLSIVGDALICSQQESLYQISNSSAIKLKSEFDLEGNWKMQELIQHPGYAIKGSYEGFEIFRWEEGMWRFYKNWAGFKESCRIFEQDRNGDIYVCHGNKGVYRVSPLSDLSGIQEVVNLNELNHFAPDFFNDVALVDSRIVLSSDRGLYKIESNSILKKLTNYDKVLGKDRFINKVYQWKDNIWVFSGNEILVINNQLNSELQGKQLNYLKKLSGSFIGSFELVYPICDDKVIFGTQEGFITFNWKELVLDQIEYETYLRVVNAPMYRDSILYECSTVNSKNVSVFPYSHNSLRFSYASPWFENPESLKYQYSLMKDNDSTTKWSSWAASTQVELTTLREGDYLFKVRAINGFGFISKEDAFHFKIIPPWYRSWWMYLFYTFIILLIGVLIFQLGKKYILFQQLKRERKLRQNRLVILQRSRNEMLHSEKEIIKQEKGQLEEELVQKNNELASLAVALAHKTELLAHLKSKLEEIPSTETSNPAKFKEVIKTLDNEIDLEKHWSVFEKHFDEIHSDFLQRIRYKYPKLNLSWLLLCAYIRMNKSNKEIATALNITVAGVEKRKYRLKEKLEIETEIKLSDFISRF